MTAELLELGGAVVGALLTVAILSYLLGDNPLYRLALHLLIGAAVGYGLAVALTSVFLEMIIPALLAETGTVERVSIVVPLLLGLLLLFKGFPRSRLVVLGNLSTAFLIGVGAAVATGGALLGTIIPQTTASGSFLSWLHEGGTGVLNGLLVSLGTICALATFAMTIPHSPTWQGWWGRTVGLAGKIGRAFLLVAFGTAFATALTASLSVLIGRTYTVIQIVIQYALGGP